MEYPSNSNKNREPIEEPRVTITPVVTGNVVRQRPSAARRLRETFVQGTARSAWGYVAYDVLVPALKDTFLDAVEGGLRRLVLGDDSRSTSRRGRSSISSPGHINYGGYSKPTTGRYGRDEPRREMSRVARVQHNFDEIVLDTRAEAEVVIERLTDLIDQYQVAKVSDMYDLCGVTSEFTDEKYGWYDLRDARAERVRGGYLLNLPRPELLRD